MANLQKTKLQMTNLHKLELQITNLHQQNYKLLIYIIRNTTN